MKTTVMELLRQMVADRGEHPALKHKRDGRWETLTWKDYETQIRLVAKAFIALGLEPGKAVSILGNNCPQWFISDLAAIYAGAIPGGIYTTSSSEQCHYIAEHSEANIVVVEDAGQLAKFATLWDRLPDLKAIVMMNGADADARVHAWEDLPGLAAGVTDAALEERIQNQRPDDCCTLIYTSGTTGNPKGVMITHHNIVWTARTIAEICQGNDQDQLISYLPLSHIAEQMVSLMVPMAIGATSWFAESLDQLGDNLREVQPTIFVGVPRVWEKIQAKMVEAGARNPPLKKKIAAWARKQGIAGARALEAGRPKPALYPLADKLVFSKVRERLGFERCRLFFSTAAPIAVDTLEFFMSLGVPITEVYGMSECTGPHTVSLPEPHRFRIGWAGPPMPGTELALGEFDEILMRGPHVFKGYYKNETATRATIDAEGWLHSGDVGEIDAAGLLKVTDRMKELIITAGGENIPPQVLEGKMKAIPVVNQVVVVGDRRKYIAALLTLDPAKIPLFAEEAGSRAGDAAAAAECGAFRGLLQRQVDAVNATLPRSWTIKKFVILPEELSVAKDELTPTMKLKRRIIMGNYAAEIEGMYAD
ncbi:MAG: AMP-binding protein [Desulfobacterales bacterium]|nr:AMP-binding protein [Desulfobacterales bacterium]MDJ0854453.1 AMP-binding protein [Desulfobacterales bacterium]MDJ0885930.1 AMP-binding protein [Desulfobacterales bacterium]MDJ0990057.1 AMP-binding protein [Desulfobacterales bacterium]